MMQVTVNGRTEEIAGGMTVAAYLERRGLDWRSVAVEVNGGIVKREAFGSTVLRDQDKVEIVQFVGGG